MPVIFISYRREDSAGHAGRLFDRLREHFGRDRVFLDVVGIEAGVDFVDTIDKAVGSCDVLLAVIGRDWVGCCDKQGRRRLDDPHDFIRTEISAALKRNVRVVPVLVEGAEMPPTDDLPEELKSLTRRQAVELRDSRWDADIEALVAALERDAARGAPPPSRVEPARVEAERKPGRPALLWGIGALVAALIAVGLYLSFSGPRPEPEPGPVDPSPIQQPQQPEPREPEPQQPEPEPEPRTVSTPDLVGLPLERALEKLRTSGLTAGEQQAKQTTDAPARQVLSQFPRAGKEIDPDTSVDLVYAELPPDTRIAVPNVVGTDVKKAMETLRGAGFGFTRRSEQSAETKFKVLRQEPAAGSRVEKGTKVTLIYAFPAEDREPAEGRTAAETTTVFIHYAGEADQAMAEDLESYLRGLGMRGESRLSRRLETGKLFYPSESQAELARSIAGRSGSWLSDRYGRRVRIETELNPRVARNGLILTLPGPP
jgi:hypothetical protein